MKKRMKSAGFSLIEVIVAVSILVILAGIAIPVVSNQVEKARAGKILSLVDSLRGVCERHKADTGVYALEYSDQVYAGAQYHTLSIEQVALTGWDGPYIDHPLTVGDNPFEDYVYLYANLTGGTVRPNGFDLTGGGTVTHRGNGNFIGFGNVPQNIAEMVNDALDKGVPGNWRRTGRVEYAGNRLAVFLCGGIN